MRIAACLVLLTFLFGCTTENNSKLPPHLIDLENLTVHPENPDPASTIELTKEMSFGDTDDIFFGQIIENVSIDDQGRVFIADMTENTVHVFNPDGSYLQSIGREGRGPGEFQYILDMKMDHNKIHILDYQQSKISVFDLTTLSHIAAYNVSLDDRQQDSPSWLTPTQEKGLFYMPTNFFVRSDQTYLILFSDQGVGSANNVDGRTYEASLFNPENGAFMDHDLLSFRWTGQVLVHEEGTGMRVLSGVPYKRDSRFDFSNDQFVSGWSEEMLFKVYNEQGEYQRAFYYPYANVRFHKEDLLTHYDEAGEELLKIVMNDDHPQYWPAFYSMTIDDKNRLWLSTIVEDQEYYEWWVLDENGELLATFTWPRNRELKEVKNDYAYTLERNRETGLPEVVRYSVNLSM